jgi:hypothetical protein
MQASNEAEPEQLDIARAQGSTYGQALEAMDEESGAVTQRAGDTWSRSSRRTPRGCTSSRTAGCSGVRRPWRRTRITTTMPFLWHPYLYHYGTNARVPGEGPYSIRVRIDPPTFMRHDPVNGKRYERPVELVFRDRPFTLGRKPSPEAQPRGPSSPYAG